MVRKNPYKYQDHHAACNNHKSLIVYENAKYAHFTLDKGLKDIERTDEAFEPGYALHSQAFQYDQAYRKGGNDLRSRQPSQAYEYKTIDDKADNRGNDEG